VGDCLVCRSASSWSLTRITSRCTVKKKRILLFFFPVVDVLAHNVAATFFKYLMTNFIYTSVQTVWIFVFIGSVSLLTVFFRVILVDFTCSASYCGCNWTDYKTDTDCKRTKYNASFGQNIGIQKKLVATYKQNGP
jgi:hypothetical protein